MFTEMYTTLRLKAWKWTKTGWELAQLCGPDLLSERFQGWSLPLPDDRPALHPHDLHCAGGALTKDFNNEAFASPEELQRDATAKDGGLVFLQGERGVSSAKGTDAVVERGLVLFIRGVDAKGDPDKDEAAVGREITRLRSVLLNPEDGSLPRQKRREWNRSRSRQRR